MPSSRNFRLAPFPATAPFICRTRIGSFPAKRTASDAPGGRFNGGALLLIADHAPFAGAAADLAYVLGVAISDVWAYNTPRGITRRSDHTVRPHPIFEGRNPSERVDSVATWVAQAFHASAKAEPLLVFGPDATGYVLLGEMGQQFTNIPDDEWPRFAISGWLLGAARRWGEGRLVVLGDGTVCTAQYYGPTRERLGMNHPSANRNAQFCLNVVRWLSGVLN